MLAKTVHTQHKALCVCSEQTRDANDCMLASGCCMCYLVGDTVGLTGNVGALCRTK